MAELEELLRANGIIDYSIFFDEEANTLFAVEKLTKVLFGKI